MPRRCEVGDRGTCPVRQIDDVYKVQKKLGEGQTAVVLLGERLADGKHYALKCFRLNEGVRAACEGLRDEVEVLRALPKHMSIVGRALRHPHTLFAPRRRRASAARATARDGPARRPRPTAPPDGTLLARRST